MWLELGSQAIVFLETFLNADLLNFTKVTVFFPGAIIRDLDQEGGVNFGRAVAAPPRYVPPPGKQFFFF